MIIILLAIIMMFAPFLLMGIAMFIFAMLGVVLSNPIFWLVLLVVIIYLWTYKPDPDP